MSLQNSETAKSSTESPQLFLNPLNFSNPHQIPQFFKIVVTQFHRENTGRYVLKSVGLKPLPPVT